jgi:pSer/pThr/pTyr-binding forkhead associated (FHA) protein
MGSGALCHALQTKKFMVGRTKTTAVCLKDSEVSQRHAELLWSADRGWTLTDKGSSNGTKVNGTTLEEGGACPPLSDARQ